MIVRSVSGILSSRMGLWRQHGANPAPIVISGICGLVLALLILTLGPISLPIVLAVLIGLPWILRDVFKLFIWLIVTWPLLALFVRFPLPAGIPDLSYDRVLVLLLLSIVILQALVSKRKLQRITTLDILVIVYMLAQTISRISVIWFGGLGTPDLNGLLDIILMPSIMYWAAKNIIVSKLHMKWLLCALVIACLLICLTGLYEQATGVRVFKSRISLGGTEVVYQWIDSQGGLRAAGVLGNPAIYGATLGMGILAGLAYLSYAKPKVIKASLVATIGILLYGVFASLTRSAWLSVTAVLFPALFLINGLWKKTLPIIALGLLLFSMLWSMLPDSSKIIQRALTTKTINQRFEVINIGVERFLEKPLTGWGAGALNIFNLAGAGITSHNTYLTFLVDGGLVLFLCFCAAIGFLLTRVTNVFRMTKRGSLERNVLVAMTGSILIYLLSGMALELRYFGYFNTLFWICAGVIDLLGIRYIDGRKVPLEDH